MNVETTRFGRLNWEIPQFEDKHFPDGTKEEIASILETVQGLCLNALLAGASASQMLKTIQGALREHQLRQVVELTNIRFNRDTKF